MTDATPMSKARLDLAVLADEGCLRLGLSLESPELQALSAGEARSLVDAVQQRRRERAPPVAEFDTGGDFHRVRLSKLLRHDLALLADGSDVRCVGCLDGGSRQRASGRCFISRVTLCHDCNHVFHTAARVTDE